MQKNKKVLVGLAVIGISFSMTSATHASYNWKDYFSFGEKTSISKVANSAVLNGLKNNDDWKQAIHGSNIADGAIGTDKLDANAVTTDKIKDGTITGADIKAGTITA